MNFSDLTLENCIGILNLRHDTTLTLDAETAGFQNIEPDCPGLDVTKPFEMPPVIMDRRHTADIVFQSGDDLRGRWFKVVVLVRYYGGKIIYTKQSN